MLLVEHSSLEEEYVTDQRKLGAVGVSQGKRGKINCPQIRLGARRRLKFQTDASCKEKRHGSFLVIVIVLATSHNSEFLHMLRFMLMFDAQSIFTIYSQLRLYYLGVANGPSKTLGLAKFYSNFTGLAVSFFCGYVRLAVSFFIRRCLALKTI